MPVIARNILGVAAVALISYGAWLIHEPSGFIIAGLLVLAGVMLASKAKIA